MTRLIAATVAAALALAAAPRQVSAKVDKTFTYRYPVIWSTTIRLIRADQGYKISDKDRDNGYILFTFPGQGRVKECAGTMELFQVVDRDGYKRVQVNLRIAHQPSYIGLHLLEKLEQKLREEQGEQPPARRVKPKRPAPPPQAPKDEDKNQGKGKSKG